jgi:hypothetical protein
MRGAAPSTWPAAVSIIRFPFAQVRLRTLVRANS